MDEVQHPRRRRPLAYVLAFGLLAGTASAAELSATLHLSATVLGSCTAPLTGNISFGNLNPGSAASPASTNVKVTCTSGVTAHMFAPDSANANTANGFRYMKDSAGTNSLWYRLDLDGTVISRIYGSSQGTLHDGLEKTHELTATLLDMDQTKPRGFYSDLLTLTLRYEP